MVSANYGRPGFVKHFAGASREPSFARGYGGHGTEDGGAQGIRA